MLEDLAEQVGDEAICGALKAHGGGGFQRFARYFP